MNYIYTVENKEIKLSDEIASDLVGLIPKKYDNWDDSRAIQKTDTQTIRNSIYQKKEKTTEKGKEWKSHVNLPDLYELHQTLKAHLWENIYQNPDGMFDVSGKNKEAEGFANTQKASLVNIFEEMKIQFEIDKCVSDLIETGDGVLFVGWETRTKQIRRKKTIQEKIQGMFTGSRETFAIEEKVMFDGAKVKSIDPMSFVFDASKKDNWDSCGKIYRSWATYDEIASNKVYQLDAETKEELKEIGTNPDNQNNDNLEEDYKNKKSRGDQLEILEYWGDIKLTDGTILRNWLITIAARTKIIRFEANPYIINPFVYGNLIEDPETKRGISPLRIALVINEISNDILNKNLDALALISNPPYLAPQGCLSGEQNVSPGKIIEYDPALMTQVPTPLKFDSALQGWEFIQFFDNKVESATGINKYLSGDNQGSKVDFATEAQGLMGGGNTRLSLSIDAFNQKITVPMVEKVADLQANFKFGAENIPAKIKGKPQFIEVNDQVRQADYKYTYGDRKAIQEKKNRFKDLSAFFTQFTQVPQMQGRIDWLEVFKYGLEIMGIENTEQFIMDEMGGMPNVINQPTGFSPESMDANGIVQGVAGGD